MLISTVKKIFVKSPSRVLKFKEMCPKFAGTRWGTWLNAALYYAENIHVIKDFINSLDPNESSSIEVAIGLIVTNTLE